MPGATLYKKVTRTTYCRLIIGERFFHNFLSLEIFGDICIYIRRRSVAIRETLQKQKHRVR